MLVVCVCVLRVDVCVCGVCMWCVCGVYSACGGCVCVGGYVYVWLRVYVCVV